MNSMIHSSRLLAAVLCAAVLMGCNAVEDVPDEPTAAAPLDNLILGGHIKDLGSRRPLVLQLNGMDACLVPINVADPLSPKKIDECRFLGVPDQEKSSFSFSAINAAIFPRLLVGQPYTITVKRQPFGKVCTVANPTGTLKAVNDEIEVTCADDPAVTHYAVSVNTSAVSSRPGLRVKLTTENGSCTIDATGLPSPITFTPDKCREDGGYHQSATYIFNNGVNLPHFQWQVTASVPGDSPASPRRNCYMTGGKVDNTGGNTEDNDNSLTDLGEVLIANRPAGNETVTVSACGFPVTLQADYVRNFVLATTNSATNNLPSNSASATLGFTQPAIAGGDGVLLSLRSQPTLVDVAAARITSFAESTTQFMVPDANGEPTGTPYEAQSDLNAFYEVVVKQSPAGMACVPGYSTNLSGSQQGTRTVGTQADAGAVLLRRPSSDTVAQAWLVNRVIRCRNIPAPASQLRGVYQQQTRTTTTTTTGSTGEVTVTAPTVRNRNFLTFFDDGTYLFGSHSGTPVGVEQGFYAYNPTGTATASPENQPGNSINFVNTTETNGANGINSSGATRLLYSVVRDSATSPKTITGLVSDGNVIGYVSAGINVSVNQGIAQSTGSRTYSATGANNLARLVLDINNASDPGSVLPDIASIQGTEILFVGPPGGVVFNGAAVVDLGLPASLAPGETAVSTNVNARLTRTVRTKVEWILEEVTSQDPLVDTIDPKDGAWVAVDWQREPAPVEDRRRIFVYQHGLYTAVSVGVNGIANFMEACYVDESQLVGSWTKQSTRSTAGGGAATSAGCSLRQYTMQPGETLEQLVAISRGCGTYAPLTSTCSLLSATSGDFPSTVGNVIMTDFPGRWPQSQAQDATDGRPVSLVDYELRPANSVPSDPVCPTLDKLTVWDTNHGLRKDQLTPPVPRIVLCRITAN